MNSLTENTNIYVPSAKYINFHIQSTDARTCFIFRQTYIKERKKQICMGIYVWEICMGMCVWEISMGMYVWEICMGMYVWEISMGMYVWEICMGM